ncbi:Hypothetical_protein [Hexamita inflata]|uniref:Hypothetical_protein n=1 Tax=Hexamita inflata TaxID=28002 RepID=A0AA86N868_9EUKA|nr:Hypothetical protein HINF_LOCUS2141 [Hexamita inflata]
MCSQKVQFSLDSTLGQLLGCVQIYGKKWSLIQKLQFPDYTTEQLRLKYYAFIKFKNSNEELVKLIQQGNVQVKDHSRVKKLYEHFLNLQNSYENCTSSDLIRKKRSKMQIKTYNYRIQLSFQKLQFSSSPMNDHQIKECITHCHSLKDITPQITSDHHISFPFLQITRSAIISRQTSSQNLCQLCRTINLDLKIFLLITALGCVGGCVLCRGYFCVCVQIKLIEKLYIEKILKKQTQNNIAQSKKYYFSCVILLSGSLQHQQFVTQFVNVVKYNS